MQSHPIRALITASLAVAFCATSFAAKLDTTPPSLLSFKPLAVADAALPAGGFRIDLKASDDLSGVQSIYAYATGPNGRLLTFTGWEFSPGKSLSRSLSLQGPWTYLEPGTYTFTSARIWDTASNTADYDQAALAALGSTSFTLKNKAGFDVVPPELVSGKILTPSISASAKHPGTDFPAKVGVDVTARDAGNTATSGVGNFGAVFCTVDGSECFDVSSYGFEFNPGPDAVKLRGGGSVYGSPGEYHLYTLTLSDLANNQITWTSIEFGGTTDFSTYFPSVAITVAP